MSTPTQPVVKYKLDRERSFEWTNVAHYRLGCLALRPVSPYAQLVAMLWATLSEQDAKDFPTPESLTKYVPPEESEKFYDAIIDKIRPTGDEAKNDNGSTPKPLQSSS